jgi:hypothetical protein
VLGIFPEGDALSARRFGRYGGRRFHDRAAKRRAYPAGLYPRKRGCFAGTDCYFGEVFTVSDIKSMGINKETAERCWIASAGIYRNLSRVRANADKIKFFDYYRRKEKDFLGLSRI